MLTAKEIELKVELQSLCDQNGKEIDPTKSANVLYKLAQFYMNKLSNLKQISSSDSQGNMCNEGKILFIQIAALICAARIRSSSEFNQEEIQKTLQKLCFELLKTSRAKMFDFDLIDHAKSLKIKIKNWRQEVKIKLNKIKKIPDGEMYQTSDIQKQLKQLKIDEIEKLQTEVTFSYKSLMAEISQTCLKVMGSTPCAFSLVGLGSLSRNETTPYSDFESIIVLQDDVKDQEILEYFRWFSVLFQTILINLDETILPSVCIPCLNNFETEDGDWFYDAYSGRGICFDGMMPFASKSPLGRQTLTEKKPWKTELIQPISKMVQYLDHEEDLKNEYHLADILTNTCFIDGDRDIYETFAKSIQKKLEETKNVKEKIIFQQLKDDMEKFNTKLSISNIIEKKSFNVKQFFYRSTTIIISNLARVLNLKQGSSFEELREMLEKKFITPEFQHDLMYAVSIACEIRLKFYTDKGRQEDYIGACRQSDSINENKKAFEYLIVVIGKQSCFDYLEIAYSLQFDAMAEFSLGSKFMYFHPVSLIVCIAYIFGDFPRLVSLKNLLVNVPIYSENHLIGFKSDNLFLGLYHQRLLEFKSQINGKINPKENTKNMGDVFLYLGKYLFKNSVYDEAIDMFKVAILMLNKCSEIRNESKFAKVYFFLAECHRKLNKFERALKDYSTAKNLNSAKQTINNEQSLNDCLKGEGQCLMKLNRFDEAVTCFQQCLSFCEKKKMLQPIVMLRWKVCVCFEKQEKFEKALDNFLKLKQFYDDNPNINLSEYFRTKCIGHIGHCYTKLEKYEEAQKSLQFALKYYNSTDDIKKQSKCKQRTADCYYDLGICFNFLKHHEKGVTSFKECLGLAQKLIQIDDNKIDLQKYKTSIENCQKSIGTCYLYGKNFPKAIEYFENAEKTHLSINKQYISSFHCKQLGKGYYNIGQYKEALKYFEKALDVERGLSKDPLVNENVTVLLSNYIKTLVMFRHTTEDIRQRKEKYLKIQIEINLKRLKLPNLNRESILKCFTNLGFAYKYQGRFEDAIHYFKDYEDLWKSTTRCNVEENIQDKNISTKSLTNFSSLRFNKRELLLDRDGSFAFIARELGTCYNKLGFSKDAMGYFEMSLHLYEKLSDNYGQIVYISKKLGLLYKQSNLFQLAINSFQQALDIYVQKKFALLRPDDIGFLLRNIGDCHSNQRNIFQARHYFKRANAAYASLGS